MPRSQVPCDLSLDNSLLFYSVWQGEISHSRRYFYDCPLSLYPQKTTESCMILELLRLSLHNSSARGSSITELDNSEHISAAVRTFNWHISTVGLLKAFSNCPIKQEKKYLQKKPIILILELGKDHYFPLLPIIRKFIVNGWVTSGEAIHKKVVTHE